MQCATKRRDRKASKLRYDSSCTFVMQALLDGSAYLSPRWKSRHAAGRPQRCKQEIRKAVLWSLMIVILRSRWSASRRARRQYRSLQARERSAMFYVPYAMCLGRGTRWTAEITWSALDCLESRRGNARSIRGSPCGQGAKTALEGRRRENARRFGPSTSSSASRRTHAGGETTTAHLPGIARPPRRLVEPL